MPAQGAPPPLKPAGLPTVHSYPYCLGPDAVARKDASFKYDQRLRPMRDNPASLELLEYKWVNEALTFKREQRMFKREKILRKRSETALERWREEHAETERRALAATARVRSQLKAESSPALLASPQTPASDGSATPAPARKQIVRQAPVPNIENFPSHRRQGATQVVFGDGRARVLSKVFRHGKWTYVM